MAKSQNRVDSSEPSIYLSRWKKKDGTYEAVEAIRFDGSSESQARITKWVYDAKKAGVIEGFFDGEYFLVLHSHMGDARIRPGDWVVCDKLHRFRKQRDRSFRKNYLPQ